MSATAAQIAKVRRMVAEPTEATYSDASITAYIEVHPLVDANGTSPTYYAASSRAMVENTNWMATYDLNAAAADIWDEKASSLAEDYDFSADGGSYHRSQAYEQAMKQARYYRSRRSLKTITQAPSYEDNDDLTMLPVPEA